MQHGYVASYRGVPYAAGVGPTSWDVVLFTTEPPAPELGFESGPGYWRKRVGRDEIDRLTYIRTVGTYRGERCLVLGDRGDRLHIAYLGHDAYRAEELGYWMVDRGVYEVVVPRSDVGDLFTERVEFPAGPALRAAQQAPAGSQRATTGPGGIAEPQAPQPPSAGPAVDPAYAPTTDDDRHGWAAASGVPSSADPAAGYAARAEAAPGAPPPADPGYDRAARLTYDAAARPEGGRRRAGAHRRVDPDPGRVTAAPRRDEYAYANVAASVADAAVPADHGVRDDLVCDGECRAWDCAAGSAGDRAQLPDAGERRLASTRPFDPGADTGNAFGTAFEGAAAAFVEQQAGDPAPAVPPPPPPESVGDGPASAARLATAPHDGPQGAHARTAMTRDPVSPPDPVAPPDPGTPEPDDSWDDAVPAVWDDPVGYVRSAPGTAEGTSSDSAAVQTDAWAFDATTGGFRPVAASPGTAAAAQVDATEDTTRTTGQPAPHSAQAPAASPSAPAPEEGSAAAFPPAAPGRVPSPRPGDAAPGFGPAPVPDPAPGSGPDPSPAPAPDPSRIDPRWAFADLVERTGISPAEYAVDDIVDDAFCLIRTDDGYEVFYSERGARYNVQHFDDEQAAFYYLFGRLAAVAVLSGRLAPVPGGTS